MKISQTDYRKMKNSYRHDVAIYLAKAAKDGRFVTYGELAQGFGGTARGWGNALGGIAIRFKEAGLPLLPVIVVNAGTSQPSVDAVLYEDLGLKGRESITVEQNACFKYDWEASPLLGTVSC
jgi:alkylated DNA nucleotide flippase Atl1